MTLTWDGLCRLCACVNSVGNDTNLLTTEGESKGILQLIEKYLAICIDSEDSLPTSICRVCTDKLTGFHSFATQCVRSQSFFLLHKYTPLQDDIHLQYLKSEFDLGDNPIKIKYETNEDENIPNDDDDLDYIPLSNLRDSKKKPKLENKSAKRKRGRPRKQKAAHNYSEEKVFSELEKLMDGEFTDSATILQNSTDDQCNPIKKEDFDDINDDHFDYGNSDSDDQIIKPKKKLKNKFKEKKKISYIDPDKQSRKRKNYGIFKFDCHVCEDQLPNWTSLKAHVKLAHNEKAKVVCICYKYLTTRRSLLRHIAQHDPVKCFKCDTCGRIFGSRTALSNHVLYHMPKEEYPFVCCKCAKRFTTARILKSHELTHIPREERFVLPCDVCGQKFSSKGALRTHKRVIHDKLKPFICDLCGHAFGAKANLDEHRIRHGEEKNFCCTECTKRFKTKGAMIRHMDTHSDTAYQCPNCPMLLNSRRTLKNHLSVHDTKANHICPFCNKAFKRSKDLKCHVKLHTGERPYTCPWCSRTFSNGSNCRIHKRRMHPNEFQIAETLNPYAPVVKAEPKKVIHAIFKSTHVLTEEDRDLKGDLRQQIPPSINIPAEHNPQLPDDLKPTGFPITCK